MFEEDLHPIMDFEKELHPIHRDVLAQPDHHLLTGLHLVGWS